jgi:DNA-binding GntR family transcriptional regulator
MARQEDAATAQHQQLRRMILERELSPGTVVLETPLSQRLGVSRTPVREALARLAQEGLITRRTRGYVVRELTPEEIIEVFDARIVLECAMAECAATAADDFQLTRLEQITEELDALVKRLWAAAANHDDDAATALRGEIRPLNVAWHGALRTCGNNRTLARLTEQLLDVQKIYNPLMQQHDIEEIALGQRQHNEIVTALRRRDPKTAREVMTHHLTTVRQSKVAEFARTFVRGES